MLTTNTPNHSDFNGRRVVFRPDGERGPHDPSSDVVVQPGDEGMIEQGFENWNGVEGLKIYRVRFDRGTVTHLSLREMSLLGERYDVLDHNGEVLESSDLWWVAVRQARFHTFRVRDNAPDDGDEPRIAYDPDTQD